MAGRGHASTHFLLPTGSCVDMPRHGSAQSWVIRMCRVSLENKRVSGYPRRAEESPFLQLPAGPAGDNSAPSHHLACCHSRIPSSPPFPHFRFSTFPFFHHAGHSSPPHGLSGLFIPDCHSPKTISTCHFQIVHPRCLFSIVISDELSRGLLLDTVSMCSISEQVGMLIFG